MFQDLSRGSIDTRLKFIIFGSGLGLGYSKGEGFDL